MKIFRTLFTFISGSLILFSCQSNPEITFKESDKENYRPEYHFTPSSGWMNDPNGLFYYEGEYHLFYQYYPDSTVWGPMHWGHAVSPDLVKWEHLPIALEPDSLGYIFSGSAVVDLDNSSGFGSSERPPIVAIFTYHDAKAAGEGEIDYQTQGIAYSLDKGRTWKKYEGNPVIPNTGDIDFRDPKVTRLQREDGSGYWNLTLAVKDEIQFFSSEDLIHWKKTGSFGRNIGAHGGVWECPDLIPMKTESGEDKYVLLVSINPGGPQKGSATQYFIGDYVEGKFIPDDTMIRWLDYGPDNYASVTWDNSSEINDNPIAIGWMSNWLYAQTVPTLSWRSAMTVARELSLFDVDGTYLLKSTPVNTLEDLRKESYTIYESSTLPSQAVEISASVSEGDTFRIVISNELGEQVIISKEMGLVSVDRTNAGNSDFNREFAALHSAPMSWEAKELTIFLDAHSLELFINDGELVMTSILFPNSAWKTMDFSENLKNVKLSQLQD